MKEVTGTTLGLAVAANIAIILKLDTLDWNRALGPTTFHTRFSLQRAPVLIFSLKANYFEDGF